MLPCSSRVPQPPTHSAHVETDVLRRFGLCHGCATNYRSVFAQHYRLTPEPVQKESTMYRVQVYHSQHFARCRRRLPDHRCVVHGQQLARVHTRNSHPSIRLPQVRFDVAQHHKHYDKKRIRGLNGHPCHKPRSAAVHCASLHSAHILLIHIVSSPREPEGPAPSAASTTPQQPHDAPQSKDATLSRAPFLPQ